MESSGPASPSPADASISGPVPITTFSPPTNLFEFGQETGTVFPEPTVTTLLPSQTIAIEPSSSGPETQLLLFWICAMLAVFIVCLACVTFILREWIKRKRKAGLNDSTGSSQDSHDDFYVDASDPKHSNASQHLIPGEQAQARSINNKVNKCIVQQPGNVVTNHQKQTSISTISAVSDSSIYSILS